MKTKFYSDNARPCWKCNGTIVEYQTDTEVSLVDVRCISCGALDLFTRNQTLTTAADVSAAHRRVQ